MKLLESINLLNDYFPRIGFFDPETGNIEKLSSDLAERLELFNENEEYIKLEFISTVFIHIFKKTIDFYKLQKKSSFAKLLPNLDKYDDALHEIAFKLDTYFKDRKEKDVIKYFLEIENKCFQEKFKESMYVKYFNDDLEKCFIEILDNFYKGENNLICFYKYDEFKWYSSDLIVNDGKKANKDIYSIFLYYGRKYYNYLRYGFELKYNNHIKSKFRAERINWLKDYAEKFDKRWKYIYKNSKTWKNPNSSIEEIYKRIEYNRNLKIYENGKELINSILLKNIDIKIDKDHEKKYSAYFESVDKILEAKIKTSNEHETRGFKELLIRIYRNLNKLENQIDSNEIDPKEIKLSFNLEYIERLLIKYLNTIKRTEKEGELITKLELIEKNGIISRPEWGRKKTGHHFKESVDEEINEDNRKLNKTHKKLFISDDDEKIKIIENFIPYIKDDIYKNKIDKKIKKYNFKKNGEEENTAKRKMVMEIIEKHFINSDKWIDYIFQKEYEKFINYLKSIIKNKRNIYHKGRKYFDKYCETMKINEDNIEKKIFYSKIKKIIKDIKKRNIYE